MTAFKIFSLKQISNMQYSIITHSHHIPGTYLFYN